MTLLYILLPLFGALPLIIIIFKMCKAQRIRKNGVSTDAEVVQIKLLPRRVVNLILQYQAGLRKELFKGKATASYGQYKLGDKLQVFYLPDNPSKMTVKADNGQYVILVLALLIFLFILFVTTKLPEMLNHGI